MSYVKPISYFGSRTSQLSKILPLLETPRQRFVDVFGGSGVVILNVTPSPEMVFNDLDHGVSTMLQAIKIYPEEFQRRITLTPYSREAFEEAKELVQNFDENNSPTCLELGLAFFIITTQSFIKDQKSWYRSSNSNHNIWEYLVNVGKRLPPLAEKFQDITVRRADFLKIFDDYDDEDTFFFVDAPHWRGESTADTEFYRFGMQKQDWMNLTERMSQIKGKGYMHFNAKPEGDLENLSKPLVQAGFNCIGGWAGNGLHEEAWANYSPGVA